jgi:hypothetical protein
VFEGSIKVITKVGIIKVKVINKAIRATIRDKKVIIITSYLIIQLKYKE